MGTPSAYSFGAATLLGLIAALVGCSSSKSSDGRREHEQQSLERLTSAWTSRNLARTLSGCIITEQTATLTEQELAQRNAICEVDWPLAVIEQAVVNAKKHPAGKADDATKKLDDIQHDLQCADLFLKDAMRLAGERKPIDEKVAAAFAGYAAQCPQHAEKMSQGK